MSEESKEVRKRSVKGSVGEHPARTQEIFAVKKKMGVSHEKISSQANPKASELKARVCEWSYGQVRTLIHFWSPCVMVSCRV